MRAVNSFRRRGVTIAGATAGGSLADAAAAAAAAFAAAAAAAFSARMLEACCSLPEDGAELPASLPPVGMRAERSDPSRWEPRNIGKRAEGPFLRG